jgi:2-hydroxychromene-2-carboxylate isomerase
MIKSFDFYFDFVSPYSFLAHQEIKKIEKKENIKIKYKPILLGGLHNLHGIKAPAFIPSKAKFMIRDCKLIAEKNKIKFKFNSYFPIKTLNLMRGVIIAEEDDFQSFYIDKIFDAIWKDGLNMNDQNIVDKVVKNIDVNPKTFFLRSSSQSIKTLLKKKTDDAFDKGVFGAPTFLINNKVFWGQDRLEFALIESKK